MSLSGHWSGQEAESEASQWLDLDFKLPENNKPLQGMAPTSLRIALQSSHLFSPHSLS